MSVDAARADLTCVVADRAPLRDRREAHARLRHAFDDADALLRQATATAKPHSYREWSLWRHRLSSLDIARQVHLFAEQDDSGLLPIGSVRTIDTGMSGPDIGDLQHGQSRAPGTLPTYGLDLEALLTATGRLGSATPGPHNEWVLEPLEQQVVPDPPITSRTAAPHKEA